MIHPVVTYEDRSMRVAAGRIVRTAWVPIHRIKLANDSRIGVGDAERAYEKVLQNGPDVGTWPPPNGWWCPEEEGFFVIADGRHEYIARLMHGQRRIFIAWTEPEM